MSLRNNIINYLLKIVGIPLCAPYTHTIIVPGVDLAECGVPFCIDCNRRQRHKRLGRGGLGSVHEDGIVECTRCSDMTVIHHDLYFLLILIVITCNKYSQNFA